MTLAMTQSHRFDRTTSGVHDAAAHALLFQANARAQRGTFLSWRLATLVKMAFGIVSERDRLYPCGRQNLTLLLAFRQEEVEKIKEKKNKNDDDLRKHTEKDDGRKKRRVLKHAEKRSRSTEGKIEKDEKKRRKLKAESVGLESISDTDL